MKRLYIAYGSNLSRRQMKNRWPESVEIGTGVINHYELLFKLSKTGFYATIEEKEDSTVPVLVWEISSKDEKSLDRYEGFPNCYKKKQLNVHMNTGEMVLGIVYVLDIEKPKGKPKDGYYNLIKQSYEELGFNVNILKKALKISNI